VGICVGMKNFFLGQSIGIDGTNPFQVTFFVLHRSFWRHSFARLVAVRVGVAHPSKIDCFEPSAFIWTIFSSFVFVLWP